MVGLVLVAVAAGLSVVAVDAIVESAPKDARDILVFGHTFFTPGSPKGVWILTRPRGRRRARLDRRERTLPGARARAPGGRGARPAPRPTPSARRAPNIILVGLRSWDRPRDPMT